VGRFFHSFNGISLKQHQSRGNSPYAMLLWRGKCVAQGEGNTIYVSGSNVFITLWKNLKNITLTPRSSLF